MSGGVQYFIYVYIYFNYDCLDFTFLQFFFHVFFVFFFQKMYILNF